MVVSFFNKDSPFDSLLTRTLNVCPNLHDLNPKPDTKLSTASLEAAKLDTHCTICLEPFEQPEPPTPQTRRQRKAAQKPTKTPQLSGHSKCGHIFHGKCLNTWFKSTADQVLKLDFVAKHRNLRIIRLIPLEWRVPGMWTIREHKCPLCKSAIVTQLLRNGNTAGYFVESLKYIWWKKEGDFLRLFEGLWLGDDTDIQGGSAKRAILWQQPEN